MSDTTLETRFIEPLDVLFLRGNKLFGDPGSYGESLVPPWPSVAAGALRSRMLADGNVDLAAFACGEVPHDTLGTPAVPGSFAVTAFHLARRFSDGRVEALIAPPADLVVSASASGALTVSALTPTPLPSAGAGFQCSAALAAIPVLAETVRSKPASGYWLAASGWVKYLNGETPGAGDLVKSSDLWAIDARVGVGLDAATHSAVDGRLFSVQAVAMTQRHHGAQDGFDVGFVAAVSGATLPEGGTVRLGGDGRAAAIHAVTTTQPEPDYAALAAAKRCRLVLATPGVFTGGWLPTGFVQADDGSVRFDLAGVKARLVCAAVPRFETVSGWDLARWQPKPAQRAAPAGSVYWLDELDATPDALRRLATAGLWEAYCEDSARRAEGFNRLVLAGWRQ